MAKISQETIAAQATPPGRGGVGIIRVSGPMAAQVATELLGVTPKARHAWYGRFLDADQATIDEGIALYFIAPNSFTGEDVLELQGHGGPVVMDCLLQRILSLGVRMANPGEFSERAFLNDKVDLAQAEAIADLIDASSKQAAKSAINSLQGEFSNKIHALVEKLIKLRIYVEAAIDFPDEEIDFLSDGKVAKDLATITTELQQVLDTAQQGALLRDGMTVVIAGKPNAGKSSLLNRLSGQETAIVTDIPGTTRDVLREKILIDGMPVHIVDTAGLRESDDIIEQEGVRRAEQEIAKADRVLYVNDASKNQTPEIDEKFAKEKITLVQNKIDLVDSQTIHPNITTINVSAKTGLGMELLRSHLKDCMGYHNQTEGQFIARRRHISALETAKSAMIKAERQLTEYKAGELVAEELNQAQRSLSEITGDFTSDELLGRIFSEFCIGK